VVISIKNTIQRIRTVFFLIYQHYSLRQVGQQIGGQVGRETDRQVGRMVGNQVGRQEVRQVFRQVCHYITLGGNEMIGE